MDQTPQRLTGAQSVMACCAAAGMPAIFGVPGGGSSLDLIAAAKRQGIPFVLARTEGGAGIMAAALAELTHRPVGLLTTRGPGVSNAANAMANAALERAPVILFADGFPAAEARFTTHQWFDQAAMLAPVTLARQRTQDTEPAEAARAALEAMLGAPRGPAYLELPGDVARAPARAPAPFREPALPPPGAEAIGAARRIIAQARRPALILGLEATPPDRAAAARALAPEDPAIPVIVAATAHPAKFPDAVARATSEVVPLPPALADLYDRPERLSVLPNDLAAAQGFVRRHALRNAA